MKANCPRCNGEGKIDSKTLSAPLRKCLETMAALGTPTCEEIHLESKCKFGLTATHRRVSRLVKLHLAKPAGPASERPMRFRVV